MDFKDLDTSEIDAMDHIKLIKEFNSQLFDLLKQLNLMIKDDDIKYYYNAFNDVIKINNKLVIVPFIQNVLIYSEEIKAKDVNFFLKDNDVADKYKSDKSVTSQIFKFKDLFLKLSEPQRELFFFYLNLLCYISARYFTLTDV
jgi:hypothetical protein